MSKGFPALNLTFQAMSEIELSQKMMNQDYKTERRFLNVKELAEYLGVREGTIYSWVCYKRIPYLKIGRLVKFDMRKIDAWTQENAIEVLD